MRTDYGAVPRKKIEHARRNTGFLEHLHEHGATDDRLLGRFHDYGVSSNNSGRRHAAENRDREIPRRNYECYASRPVMMITFLARHLLREFRPPESPHLLRVERAEIDCFANVAVSFRPRLANFENFDCREFITPALQDFRHAFQQSRPLLDRRPSPFFECSTCSFNGTLCFVDSGFGSVTDNLRRLSWIDRR